MASSCRRRIERDSGLDSANVLRKTTSLCASNSTVWSVAPIASSAFRSTDTSRENNEPATTAISPR